MNNKSSIEFIMKILVINIWSIKLLRIKLFKSQKSYITYHDYHIKIKNLNDIILIKQDIENHFMIMNKYIGKNKNVSWRHIIDFVIFLIMI